MNEKESIEKQFQELADKAKALYPDIEQSISTLSNTTMQTNCLQDYLNLTIQTPTETSSNQIVID